MDHDSIKEVFKPCGAVTEVRLRHGKFVLVFFRQRASAAKAIEMDGKTVKGSKITVCKARKAKPTRQREHYCTTIYAGGLPGCTTEGQLFKHFKSAGKILKIRLHQPYHQAFIYFQDNKAAKKAFALKDVPFAHGKDVSKLETVPIQWQRKLHLRFSIRTKKFDRIRAKKRFNRRPPSEIEADRRKSEKRQVGRQRARRLAAAGKAKKSTDKKSSAKKTSDKKKSTDKKSEKKAETKPKKPEPKKAEEKKSEPKKAEEKKVEKKPETKKPEPKKSEEKKVEKKSEEKKPAAKATPKAAPKKK